MVPPRIWSFSGEVAASLPTMPPAPVRVSTTNCWPSRVDRVCALARAALSLALPLAPGTITRTGH